jgi:hypothetical protein
MSAPTLIFIRHGQVGDRQFHFGDELPPGLVSQEVVDHWLDENWLKAHDSTQRPSLYRLFARFTGATPEQPLTQEQAEKFCLQE